MSAAVLDQIAAAQQEVRRMMSGVLGLPPGQLPKSGRSPLIDAVLDRLLTRDAHRCQHLAKRPIQPWICIAWERVWRCRACALSPSDSRMTPRWAGLGLLEEQTCDHCRRYSSRPLTPLLLRADLFVVVMAVCARCERGALEAGAELKRSA